MEGVDFGSTAPDYARYRAGFPDSFFSKLGQHGVVIQGARAVDLGTGTGTVARELATRGASLVVGIDPAQAITREAQNLDEAAGIRVEYVNTAAESTGLPSRSFDLVIAGRGWWWFESSSAVKEASRILVPDGHLVIASLDWLPLPGSVAAATERLIRQANPRWTLHGGNGRHPGWMDEVKQGGFSEVRSFEYDLLIPYTAESWRGRIRASAGIGASLSPDEVQEFDRTHARLLANQYPCDELRVPHRIYAVIGQEPM
ncbi:MAG: class I SAM-dependent methyltransferase, partial [Gammaproteobacteria bacterium]|nr:class I SAM-dependent methyltransferase [Gammaproteobacteria bacterium]